MTQKLWAIKPRHWLWIEFLFSGGQESWHLSWLSNNLSVGWHHRLHGHEFEQGLGVGDGQGGLVCCSPWGRKELDTTEQLN